MQHDFGYKDRQQLIVQSRTQLEMEMRANWRLWVQVTWRRFMRGNLKHAYISGTHAQKAVRSISHRFIA